jgi:hypothetical protein
LPIEDVAGGVIALLILWASAELITQKDVAATLRPQSVRQLLPVGPRDVSGMWPRTDIDENLYRGMIQKPEEVLWLMIRVADGE